MRACTASRKRLPLRVDVAQMRDSGTVLKRHQICY